MKENEINKLIEQANEYVDKKEYDKALELFEKVIALDNANVRAYNEKGIIYYNLKEYDKALECYNKAIELDANYIYAYNNKGNVYDDLKEYEMALEYYNKALELNKEYVFGYNGKGNVYSHLKEYDKALEYYSKAIELDKTHVNAYNGKGIIYRKLKEYDKALEYYNEAIKLDSTYIHAYNNKAIVYEALEEYDKALEFYNKAIALDSKYVNAINGRGIIYENKKEYEKALLDYDTAIKLDDKYSWAYRNKGDVYVKLKKYDNAIKEYKKAVIINPDLDDELKYLIENAQTELEEQKKNEENEKRQEISDVIDEIKRLLEYDGSQVCHYTSIEVLRKLCNGSPLRFSHSNLVNDPTEGKALYNFFKLPYIDINRKGLSNFIGSFVGSHNNDSLPLWRAYGGDGKGVSFCLDINGLSKFNKKVETEGKTSKVLEDIPKIIRKLYRVVYIDDGKILLDGKESISLNSKLLKLKHIIEPLINDDNLNNEEAFEPLEDIQYLFKNGAYIGENEVRYYELLSDDFSLIQWDENLSPPTTYIEVENNILTSIRNVTVGPKAENASSWVAWYKTKLARHGNNNITVTQSKIPYR